MGSLTKDWDRHVVEAAAVARRPGIRRRRVKTLAQEGAIASARKPL